MIVAHCSNNYYVQYTQLTNIKTYKSYYVFAG